MAVAACPTCQRKVSLPENTTGRTVKTMCPKCGELLSVPPTQVRHPEDARLAALHAGRLGPSAMRDARAQLSEALATTRGMGLLTVLLGLLAFAFLAASFCLPDFVGYVGLPLSGIGLLLASYGTLRGAQRRERDALYPVGGVAVCGLALGLILAYRAFAQPDKGPRSNDDTPTILEQRKDLR